MSKTYQKEKSKQSRFLVFQKQSRFLVFQKQSRFSVFQKQSRFLVFQKHQIKHIKVLSIFQSNYVKKKTIERRSIFPPLKSGRKKYLERTSIFRTPKLCQKMYVKLASVIGPSKYIEKVRRLEIHWYFLRSIDMLSTASQRRFDAMWCPLGLKKRKSFIVILKKCVFRYFFSLGIVNANNANDYKVRFRAHCYVPIFQWQILKAYASMRYLSHVSRW